MDIINIFNAELDKLINKELIKERDSINVNIFSARESLIENLNLLISTMPEITSKIQNTLNETKDIHEKEIKIMDTLMNKMKKDTAQSNVADDTADDATWTTVTRRKNPDDTRSKSRKMASISAVKNERKINQINKTLVMPTLPISSKTQLEKPTRGILKERIKFTEALSLPAIKVPTFDYVEQNGELYFVECANHFAFKLCGYLLHGNIGTIYTDEKNPEKIKDCKFASSCMKQEQCDYYHDPVHFYGSKDYRNFIAGSWLYIPPNSQFKNRSRSRRFGSRDHLDVDIVGLVPEEISRFQDQAMHDILCALLLNDSYRQD